MAKYLIQQKYFSFKDSFAITDESGQTRFMCRSKWVTVPKKFWLESASGKPVYFIRQRIFSPFGRFDIYSGDSKEGDYLAKVSVRPTLFRKKIRIESEQFGVYTIRGSVMAWSFRINEGKRKDGELYAEISKKILRIADSYVIDVKQGKESFILALGIIIDFLYHKKH